MSITIGTKTVTVEERTWKIEILCEKGDDPLVRAYREEVWTDDAGNVTKRDRSAGVVQRRFSQVMKQDFKAPDGSAFTGAAIAGAIAAAADIFWQEDAKAEALRLEELAKAPPPSGAMGSPGATGTTGATGA